MYPPQQPRQVSVAQAIAENLDLTINSLLNDRRIPYQPKLILTLTEVKKYLIDFIRFALNDFKIIQSNKIGYEYKLSLDDVRELSYSITIGYWYDLLSTRELISTLPNITTHECGQTLDILCNIPELNAQKNYQYGYGRLKNSFIQTMNQQVRSQPQQPNYPRQFDNLPPPQSSQISTPFSQVFPTPSNNHGLPNMNPHNHNSSFQPHTQSGVLGQLESLNGLATGNSYQVVDSNIGRFNPGYNQSPQSNQPPIIQQPFTQPEPPKLKTPIHRLKVNNLTTDDEVCKLVSGLSHIEEIIFDQRIANKSTDLSVVRYKSLESFIWPQVLDEDDTPECTPKDFSEFIYYLDNLIETVDKNNSVTNFKGKLDFIISREFSAIYNAYHKLELNKIAPKLYSGILNKNTWSAIIDTYLIKNGTFEYMDYWMLRLGESLLNNVQDEVKRDAEDDLLTYSELDEYWIYANRVIIPDSIKSFKDKIQDDNSDSHSLLFTTSTGTWSSDSVYSAINEIYTELEPKLVLPRINLIDKNLKTYSIYQLGSVLKSNLPKRFVMKPIHK